MSDNERKDQADMQPASTGNRPESQTSEDSNSDCISMKFLMPASFEITPKLISEIESQSCFVSLSDYPGSTSQVCEVYGADFDSVYRGISRLLFERLRRKSITMRVDLLVPDTIPLLHEKFQSRLVLESSRREKENIVVLDGIYHDVISDCVKVIEAISENALLSSQKSPMHELLVRYNDIVAHYLQHFADVSLREETERRVIDLQGEFEREFGRPAEEAMDLDPTNPSHILMIFVYIAVFIHWKQCTKLVKKGKVAEFGSGPTFESFLTNLETLNSVKTGKLLEEELPLPNKILLYSVIANFYLRPAHASFILPLNWYVENRNLDPLPITGDFLDYFDRVWHSGVVQRALVQFNVSVNWEEALHHVSQHLYSAKIPTLHGISCFEGYVFIDADHAKDYSETVIVLLHEMAHAGKRGYNRPMYFIPSPERCVNETKQTMLCEDGEYMEKLIFGKRVKELWDFSKEFLRNPDHWNSVDFTAEFGRLQRKGKESGTRGVNMTRPRTPRRVCGWSFR